MANKEQVFWERVLQLAKEKLTQSAFDFYVLDAKLLSVQDQIASVYLNGEHKSLFWTKNLEDILLTAGFEIYDQQIGLELQFSEPSAATEGQETFVPIEEPIPSVPSEVQTAYTFGNFIQGKDNAFSFAAAASVAEAPGKLYNPLFIYGGPGLGKTHLLHAIGNKVLADNPSARVRYVSSETFLNEYVDHYRLNKMEEFKNKYRKLDVLLIDDIQTLQNKKATQEEFFNTFEAIKNNGKQIVLTSDRTPEQLDNLEKRLVTRFSWGTITVITPPDYETRVAILQSKCEAYPYYLTDEALAFLANQFHSNVRDLEGALKDINLIATMEKVSEISLELAARAIRARKSEVPTIKVISIEKIQNEVAQFYGLSVKELKGSKRVQHIVHARQVAMYLARELTDNSLPKIGKEFGNRDHTTVMHAYNKIDSLLAKDPSLEIDLGTIRNKIR